MNNLSTQLAPTLFATLVLVTPLPSTAAAATLLAASCAYNDVNAQVAAAAPGDTVIVPTCSAVWSAPLRVTKPLRLVGSGAGVTTIASGFTSSTSGIVSIEPSPVTDGVYQITGFTFDQGERSYAISILGASSSPITGLRINNNEFKNVGTLRSIYLKGAFYGVIDSNVFTLGSGGTALVTRGYLDDYPCSAWGILPLAYGVSSNVYFEDNTVTGGNTPFAAGQAGRYVIRFNSYSLPTRNQTPLIDLHGNQTTVGCAAMVAEVYGNRFEFGPYGGYLLDHRGGKVVAYFNSAIGVGSLNLGRVREEFSDSINGSIHTMHVQDSYYWSNLINGAVGRITKTQDLTPPALAENVDFFNHIQDFSGQAGIGCGPLSSRPATCTSGVAYWATDQTCDDLGAVTGRAPSATLTGALYRCTTSGQWELYYVPYPYPHPLRLGMPRPPESVRVVP